MEVWVAIAGLLAFSAFAWLRVWQETSERTRKRIARKVMQRRHRWERR